MDKKYTYFEVLDKLDEIMPETTDFDYTKLTAEELWQKVSNLLSEIGIFQKLSEKEIENLKKLIDRQEVLYGRMTARVHNSLRSEGFDQNNYFLKTTVLWMKTRLTDLIIEKGYYDLEYADYEYRDNIGTIDEIEAHISPEKIEEYISKLLTVSTEVRDNPSMSDAHMVIIQSIFQHFGIKKEQFKPDELDNIIRSKLNKATSQSMIYFADFNGGSENVYESRFNAEQYKQLMKESTKEIVDKLVEVTKKKLQSRKKREEINKKDSQEKVVEILEEPKIVSLEEKQVTAIKAQEDKPEIETNFTKVVETYDKIQQTIEAQKEILRQLQELEAKKRELEAKFKENEEIIKSGVSNAI